ncbi:MAG: Hsp20/alpha crystallin family protein [Gemmatimonadetes bacterium]|nr:MAG: Hsp20/alpha crystallin family protein [Gemmatimonadota bacterium]
MLLHELNPLQQTLREVSRLQRDLNRIFGEGSVSHRRYRYPAVNVWSNENSVIVTCELPGFEPADIDISVEDGVLKISGERKPVELNENERYHRRERETGKFSRLVRMPYQIDSDGVEAHFKNGVLTITLPRAEADKPRKIEIKSA